MDACLHIALSVMLTFHFNLNYFLPFFIFINIYQFTMINVYLCMPVYLSVYNRGSRSAAGQVQSYISCCTTVQQ